MLMPFHEAQVRRLAAQQEQYRDGGSVRCCVALYQSSLTPQTDSLPTADSDDKVHPSWFCGRGGDFEHPIHKKKPTLSKNCQGWSARGCCREGVRGLRFAAHIGVDGLHSAAAVLDLVLGCGPFWHRPDAIRTWAYAG